MYSHKHCPECQSDATQVMATQPQNDTIERVRACLDCSTQFVVEYGRPEITNTKQL
jgi:transcriptional regulator NrdR family protein